MLSDGVSSRYSRIEEQLAARVRWLRVTPLGRPLVPEV